MKSRALSLCAALLLLGLMPASTLAATQPQLPRVFPDPDQSNVPGDGSSWISVDAMAGLAQTFTAGRSGFLDTVKLWMVGHGTVIVHIEAVSGGVPDGTPLASASAPAPGFRTYIPFDFWEQPLMVRAGTQYAIVVEPSARVSAYHSSDTYAGGQALVGNGPWVSMASPADLIFQTIVAGGVQTHLAWDKATIMAGETTPLTLTATMWYFDGGEKAYYVRASVPDWYSVAAVSCPASVPAASCNVQAFEDGIAFPVSNPGEPLRFTLTGTAAPPQSEAAGQAFAYVRACPDDASSPRCGGGGTSIWLRPTGAPSPAATLPPTAARAKLPQPDSDRTIWLLPIIAAVVLFGALVAFQTRRRRISNSPYRG